MYPPPEAPESDPQSLPDVAAEPQPSREGLETLQIELSDAEKTRLVARITDDFLAAKDGHLERSMRFARYMQKWENRVDPPKAGDEPKPNHTMPLVQWQCFAKMARDLQALIGDDAEITARPTGPSDAEKAAKVGAYMTSRLFHQMEILNPLAVFQFRRILFGRSIAYRPFYRRSYYVLENNRRVKTDDYVGPGFFPLEPDHIMTPPERGVQSIQDFSYVIHRLAVSVDNLREGAGTVYQHTDDTKFLKTAIRWAQTGYNDYTITQDPVRLEQERSHGVEYDAENPSARRLIWTWEWYGKWRMLRKGLDGEQDDLDARDDYETDLVVKMIPGMGTIIGVQDLLELYPHMRRRRPFCESSLIKDGSYWPQGFGALLESIEDEATANSRLFTAAGELSVWPIVFFKPGGGLSPKTRKLEPGDLIPTEDPTSVNVVKLSPNLDYAIARQQDVLAVAERVTGITDQSLGRAIDRPNAPRTATGQLALIEEGNVRAYLDATVLREDMEQIIGELWALDCDLMPQENQSLWFRVTESQAQGSAGFDVVKGGAYMTPEEFAGKFDFRLKFATSAFAREAQAQKSLSFYPLAMANPLVATNPRAMWVLLNRTAKALGIQDFSSIVPIPPELDQPLTPDQEWTKMLEGDEVQPHPQDHNDLHLIQHLKQLKSAMRDRHPDMQAIYLLIEHIRATREQRAAALAMSALTQNLIQSVAPNGGEGAPDLQQLMGALQAGGQPGQPQPQGGAPPQQPPQMPAPPQPAAPSGGYPDMPLPTTGVGSSAAPVAQNGML